MLDHTENPWSIQSIYEFQYFNCPICLFKDQSKQDFVNHAFQDHPESISSLLEIGDGSLKDIDIPTKIKTEDDPLAPLENVSHQEENENYDNEEKIYFDVIEAKTEQPDFKCDVCSECFENGQLLLEHVDSLHKKSIDHQHQKIYRHGGLQLFDCDICKEPFRSKGKLAKHLRTSHPSSNTTICDSCGTKFASSEEKDVHRIYCIPPQKTLNSKVKSAVQKIKKLPKKVESVVQKEKELPQKRHLFPEKEKDSLKCEACNTTFNNYFKISQHIYRFHNPNKNFRVNQKGTICTKCQKECSDYDTLKAHLSVDHATNCVLCQKNFDTTELLILHLLEHHKRIDFFCVTCGLFFESEKYKIEHMKNCSEQFKCPLCTYNGLAGSRFKDHIRSIHWNLYQCEECEKSFTSRDNYVIHVQKIHEEKDLSVKCDLCEKIFATQQIMRTHIKLVHKKIKNFPCEICGLQTSNSTHLRMHIQNVHEKVKNFQCDQCGMKFFNKYGHDKHFRNVHEKHTSKTHQCDKCEKSFWTPFQLNQHFDSVHNEKKFQCDKCEKQLTSYAILQKHIKFVHESTETFKCKECGKEFNRIDNHDTHVKVVHRGIKDFKCEHCGKEFARKKYLEKHLLTCQKI